MTIAQKQPNMEVNPVTMLLLGVQYAHHFQHKDRTHSQTPHSQLIN